MSWLVRLDKVDLAYGHEKLLNQVDFSISPGERVCLIGRNGAGKSSFLKIIDGLIECDSGRIQYDPGIRIACLEQDLPKSQALTVYQAVASAFHMAHRNHQYSEEVWEQEQRVDEMLQMLGLNGEQKLTELSGGWKRKVALAKALVINPHLLLLDEPTNHLDMPFIQWMEKRLLQFTGAVIFITHDRQLLRRLATRIIELDRGQLTSWPGDYDNFVRRKAENLVAEATKNQLFDKKLAQEEQWIRQGIKARRTRNEGRVRALKALREERKQRQTVLGKAKLETNTVSQSGKVVVDAKNLSHRYDEKQILTNFSIRILRGDKIGLVGPNGVGKSTLLNLLLGKHYPDSGVVTLGTKVAVAYFDQLLTTLDPKKTVLDNVAGGRSSIQINGKEKHVISYLKDFLFSSERAHMPLECLSGGERNRLLLAKLFSMPANVLVMDEPTNDLDIETLELLEELLSDFAGTLLLVSHDRAFLENVVTRVLVFEGNGKIIDYIGSYQDYLDQYTRQAEGTGLLSKAEKQSPQVQKHSSLSYEQRKELSKLPAKIEKLEAQKQNLFDKMAQPGFYEQTAQVVDETTKKLKVIEQSIEEAYARWDELEGS